MSAATPIATKLRRGAIRDDVQSGEPQRGDGRRVAGLDRGTSDARRWPNTGLCGRGGIPRRVRDHD